MCEDCWDGRPRSHKARSLPSERPVPASAVPADPHPVVKFLARAIAVLMLLACAGGCLGVVVRVFQWAWPG